MCVASDEWKDLNFAEFNGIGEVCGVAYSMVITRQCDEKKF